MKFDAGVRIIAGDPHLYDIRGDRRLQKDFREGLDERLSSGQATLRSRSRLEKAGNDSGDLSSSHGSATLNVNVHGARGNAEIEAMVESDVTLALHAYDKKLPAKVAGTMAGISKRQAVMNWGG